MNRDATTLRLLMPQWQGGNNPASYPLGARLLAWLAPENDDPLVEVPVPEGDETLKEKDWGIVGRAAVLRQARAARKIIEAYEPERIVVFGGDCLVSQSPFAYLNERYGGELGVLWIDAHPDVSTPEDFQHAHAMVLGNLLGGGDPELAAEVKIHLKPQNVLLAGVEETLDYETAAIAKFGLRTLPPQELVVGGSAIVDWIRENDIRHLAIHLDLDVLDPAVFRSLLFANPFSPPDAFQGISQGRLNFAQLTRLITDVAAEIDVVGLGIAEHMPWDAINLRTMLQQLPLLR